MQTGLKTALAAALALMTASVATRVAAGVPELTATTLFPGLAKVKAPVPLEDQVEATEAASDKHEALDPELECMAKAVRHEAGNQSLKGQLAVAQLILNRTLSGHFPKTVCAVVYQPGQFFHLKSFKPVKDSAGWRTAVAIAKIAREGLLEPIAPGALYFHAVYVRPAWGRKKVRVAQIGDHIFYR